MTDRANEESPVGPLGVPATLVAVLLPPVKVSPVGKAPVIDQEKAPFVSFTRKGVV